MRKIGTIKVFKHTFGDVETEKSSQIYIDFERNRGERVTKLESQRKDGL